MTVHPLSRLEMMLVKTLKNMGGQILGYNSRFYNPIHLQPVRRRVVMLNLELFTEFSDHRVVEISTIIRDDSLRDTIMTNQVVLDELCHHILGNHSKGGSLNPLREVINNH